MSEHVSYIEAVDLPPEPVLSRGAALPPGFGSGQQAFVVNAQLAEFDGKVPQLLRPAISHGLLLGQLAADKATAGGTDPWAWFTTYNTTMGRIGWIPTGGEINQQTISDKHAELHKAIIPVVMAALGPAAAAGSILLSALNGLQEMNKDMPWLTLFQRKSQSVRGAKFGMSYVDAGAGGGALLRTVFFAIEANQIVTQVLFVRISTSGAAVNSAMSQLLLSAQIIADTQDALAKKVAPFVVQNIANIEI